MISSIGGFSTKRSRTVWRAVTLAMAFLGNHSGVGIVDGIPLFSQVDDQSSLARAEGLDVVHIVRGEDNGHPVFAVESLDKVANREFRDGIEPDGGFVEEQDRWPVHTGMRPGRIASVAPG